MGQLVDYQRIELRSIAGKRKHDAAAMRSVRSDVFARRIGDVFPQLRDNRWRQTRNLHHDRDLQPW
jgi:hypothetical protein